MKIYIVQACYYYEGSEILTVTRSFGEALEAIPKTYRGKLKRSDIDWYVGFSEGQYTITEHMV